MSIKNNIKDWITDLIGLAIWIVAIVMLINKGIPFWPDFIGLIIVGGVFFLIPDDILTGYLKKYIGKKIDKDENGNNPPI
jgi:hypothetical protein